MGVKRKIEENCPKCATHLSFVTLTVLGEPDYQPTLGSKFSDCARIGLIVFNEYLVTELSVLLLPLVFHSLAYLQTRISNLIWTVPCKA